VSTYYVKIQAILRTHFGIDPAMRGASLPEPIQEATRRLVPYGFSWPDLDGDRLQRLQDDIARLRRSIGRVGGQTMAAARRATPDYRAYVARLEAGEDVRPSPREHWIDARAFAMLDELRDAVAEVATRHANEIAWRPNGSGGRRPARAPYMVALITARLYRDMTQRQPGFWTNGDTPYARLLEDIFGCLGIRADTRRPAEWAILLLSRETP
jgi:hypothetical protein